MEEFMKSIYYDWKTLKDKTKFNIMDDYDAGAAKEKCFHVSIN